MDRTGLPPHELFAALTVMEIEGYILSVAGSRYQRRITT